VIAGSLVADVRLGYIRLGQSAITFYDREVRRVRLPHEVSKRGAGSTLY
jgi:excinuclease UvrABC ATPase subunit